MSSRGSDDERRWCYAIIDMMTKTMKEILNLAFIHLAMNEICAP